MNVLGRGALMCRLLFLLHFSVGLINVLPLLACGCKITADIYLYFNFSVKKAASKETSRN